ncbi:MAG: FtsX-like permease family protein [Bacteroidales bacterium]|jgi:ABC-type lipoprotein release transport system permease subunit|nr:FtsX-like permease family protein [Bacteroidales bacterium]
MITSLAWKNIWRNRTRSSVILGAIALGLFCGVYINSFMTGWMYTTVDDDINNHLSHIQIHDTAFSANNDISAYFPREKVEAAVGESGLVTAASYRLSLTAMLASANNAVGITAKAVFPEDEKAVSTIWQNIADTMGAYLPDDARTAIVISKKTADKLKVKLKSKIVLTFQDTNGDMQSLALRVSGIYKTANGMKDEATVYVRYSDVFPVTGLPENVFHEAALRTADLETCRQADARLKTLLPDMDVKDWGENEPALEMSLAMTEFFGVIILAIFLFALSFGIINTMLMAVLERTRELGMLGAIGMSKRRIFNMIMLETALLTFVGSLVGIIIGTALIVPSLSSGIDLTPFMGDQFEDYGFGSIIYPVLNVKMFVQIIALVIIAGILSAIYPARKALKLKPLEAMRN